MARIAIPLAQDFEDSEFSVPCKRLERAGHRVMVFGEKAQQKVRGKRHEVETTTKAAADELRPNDFDALVIPGGYSPDHLRTSASVVNFVREFVQTGKPVAAICHGPQLLIEADSVEGRTLTSWPSVRKDLENAGATWVDQEVVIDEALITSRKPEDLDAFCSALLRELEDT
jgi:protease I